MPPVGDQGRRPVGGSRGAPRAGYSARTVLTGLSGAAAAQLATTVLGVAALPYFLLRLGVDRYGAYVLVSSFQGFLSNLDGGLGPCASRYFAACASSGDRRRASSFLFTASWMVALVVGAVATGVALLAPDLTRLLHAPTGLRAQATLLLRLFMPLLVVSSVRGIATRVLGAEGRFDDLARATAFANAVYVGVAALLVSRGHGLDGLFWGRAAEEAVVLVATAAGARHLVLLRSFRPMARRELAEVVRYAWRAQVAALASSFGNEANALLVGVLFPIRFVTYYGVGASVAGGLAGLPASAIGRVANALSRAYGHTRFRGALEAFGALQRRWVRATAAWPFVGAVAALFGVAVWLGPGLRPAGLVAAVLLVGQVPVILAGALDAFTKVLDRPDVESRYLAVATAVDVVLAVPLALAIGWIGVPLAVAAGQVAGALVLLRSARRQIDPRLRSFLADIPKLAVAAGVAVAVPLELAASTVAPRGVPGLLLCALPAVAGLGAYALALRLGPSAPPVAAGAGRRALRTTTPPALGPGAVAPVGERVPHVGEGEGGVAAGSRVRLGDSPFVAPAPVPPAAAARGEAGPLVFGAGDDGPATTEAPGLAGFVAQLEATRDRLRAARRSGVLVLVQLGPAGPRGAVAQHVVEGAAGALARAVREDDEIAVVEGTTLAAILQLDGPGRPGARRPRPADLAAIERRLAAAAARAADEGGPGARVAPRAVAVLL